jgi:ribonuclease VapC
MVIDTSAIIAILFGEAEQDEFTRAILAAPIRLMSTVNYLEAALVADNSRDGRHEPALDLLLAELEIQFEPPTLEHARVARTAYRRFGKGHHPARLNFGDCFAYALAKATGEPLLFKGEDFARTDIEAA